MTEDTTWLRPAPDRANYPVRHRAAPPAGDSYHQPGCPAWEHEHPDLEDAVTDAVMQWVSRYVDQVESEAATSGRTHVSRRQPLRRLRFLLSCDGRHEIAREVLASIRERS